MERWVVSAFGIGLLFWLLRSFCLGGGGKLSRLMGDFGRGLREFRSSLEGEKGEKGKEKKRVGGNAEGDKAKKKG